MILLTCPECDGLGCHIDFDDVLECNNCDGDGFIAVPGPTDQTIEKGEYDESKTIGP